MRFSWVFVAALTLIAAASPSRASDFHSPRTAGLGGAGHAGPFINDALYLNPSFIPYLTARSLGVNFEKFSGMQSPSGRIYNLSVQDGTAPLFQAGLGYTQRDEGGLLTAGASKSVVQRLGVGIGYKLWMQGKDGKHSKGSDGTFSVTWLPTTWLQSALIIDNLFKSKASAQRNAHREIILGTKTNIMEMLIIYFDPHWIPDNPDGQTFGHELGIEIPVFSDFFLRLGQFSNAYQPFLYGLAEGLSSGLAWVAPKLSVDIALTRVLHSSQGFQPATSFIFGATIFF
ncbi:MAG TPA: hypothetical protein VL588_04440 [Bdellovibrionota bacterium]|nr:hypothetical protein [Bdellovibrionota bacterium]